MVGNFRYALAPLVGCVVLSALAIYVLLRRRPGGPQVAFAVLNLATAAWNLDVLILYTLRDAQLVSLIDRLFQPVIVFIPLAWVNFVTAYLGSPRRRTILGAFALWSLPLAVISPTNLFHGAMVRRFFGYYALAGPLYHLFVLTYLAGLGTVVVLLAGAWRKAADPLRRKGVGMFLLATLVMGTLSADNFFPLYGVDSYPLGNVAVIIYLLLVGLAITRYRFLDLRRVVRASLVYSIATFVLTAVYLAAILLLQGLVRPYFSGGSLFVPLLPALLIALMFQGVKEWVQRRLDHLFGRDRRLTALLESAAGRLRENSRRGEILDLLDRVVAEAAAPESAVILARDRGTGRWRVERDRGADPAVLPLLPELLGAPDAALTAAIVTLDKPAGEWARRLAGAGFTLAVPLHGPSALAGAMLLGGREDGVAYTDLERSFLGALAGQVATALEAREYYDRWRREEKLTAIGRASATISHELRNPLHTIRGAVALLELHHADEGTRRFTDIIGQEVERTSRFIDRFLRAARTPPVHRQHLEAAGWLSRWAAVWRRKHPGVPLRLALAPGPVPACFDPLLVGQVLENLLRNGAEAMEGAGALTLGLERPAGRRDSNGEGIQLAVSDEGPGISPEHRESLFDPFFTTKPGGTGLGLCLVESVVRGHGGEIEVQSAAGTGTTVRIVLPASNPHQERAGAGFNPPLAAVTTAEGG